MRALLFNPWIYDFAAYDLWAKPVGLIAVASHLCRLGWQVDLLDCLDRFHPLMQPYKTKSSAYGDGHYYAEETEKPPCFSGIPRKFKRYGMPLGVVNTLLNNCASPDVILLNSGLTYWYQGAFRAIELLKKRFPGTPIILGGVYARLCYDHASRRSGADYVFKENNFAALMAAIASLTQKAEIEIPQEDLFKQFDIRAYRLYPHLEYITVMTSHGCVFECSYCGWKALYEKFVAHDPRKVAESIIFFHENHKVNNFAFYDDAMLYEADSHFSIIFTEIIKKGIHCNFHTPNGLHCRFLTKKAAALMKKANFIHPRLGLEFIDTDFQARSGGKVVTAEFEKALQALVGCGYRPADIEVNVLIGLPGQKFSDVEKTILFLGDHGVRIHLEEFSPVPYSRDFQKTGLCPDDDPLLHNNTAFVLRHPEFGERLQALKDRVRAFNHGVGNYS